MAWQVDLATIDSASLAMGWEYALLNRWIVQGKVTREQAIAVICAVIAEVLFDVAQAATVQDHIRETPPFANPLTFVEVKEAIFGIHPLWQAWQASKLANYSPDQSPIVRQADQFKALKSPQAYQNLVKMLNGERSLRDLAVAMHRNLIEVAKPLLPYLESGWIELIHIPDLSAPIYRQRLSTKAVDEPVPAKKPVIACVDDSLFVQNMMEKLLTSAGYNYVGINDGLRAIGILLARKPDLIFLDLMMPNTNGYEICEQLRKLTHFQNTPIVILTGNDGFANRLRSNFVGASDFLTKPLDAEAVLGVIRKFLSQDVSTLPVSTNY